MSVRGFSVCVFTCLMVVFSMGCQKEQAFAPLPATALKADLQVGTVPAVMKAGSSVNIPVSVKNLGDRSWPAGGEKDKQRVKIAYRWLDRDGRVVKDGGRALLPGDIAPGQEVTQSIRLNAQIPAGEYKVHVDMVQEGLVWFSQKGSTRVVFPVKIEE